jgi:hypothetical protein
MIVNRKWVGLRGLSLGYMGFGLGMALGRLAANAIRHAPFDINHWNVMEVGCGLIGGLVFAFGMLGRKLDDLPDEPGWASVSRWSILYVMGFIPLLHRMARIDAAKNTEEWARTIQRYGMEDPDRAAEWAGRTLLGLNGLCALGFVAAGVWLVLWKQNRTRWAAFPVLAFNLLMLLFQNLSSLYFFEQFPGGRPHVNMHTVFWWLFAALVLFVLAFETIWPRRDVLDAEERFDQVPWRRWLAVSVLTYAAILFGASYTNNEETMKSANTRFPVWAWTDGPFPGREKPAPGH